MIRAGDTATHRFTVDEAAMKKFQELSGDYSRIHTDEAYAKARGYKGVIAYGGIMLANLSHVVGNMIPGDNGTSIKWMINYREPLYVGEEAEMQFTVAFVSKAAGMIESKFKIVSGDRTIATGTAQSLVPAEEIAE